MHFYKEMGNMDLFFWNQLIGYGCVPLILFALRKRGCLNYEIMSAQGGGKELE